MPASPSTGVGERAGNRFEAEVGHGFGLAGAAGLLAPYAGLTLAEEGKRVVRLGARYRLSDRANLGIEGARRESDTTDGENSIMLRGALRW